MIAERDEPRLEHYIKQTPEQRLVKIYAEPDELIVSESTGGAIRLADIYAQIELEEKNEE